MFSRVDSRKSGTLAIPILGVREGE